MSSYFKDNIVILSNLKIIFYKFACIENFSQNKNRSILVKIKNVEPVMSYFASYLSQLTATSKIVIIIIIIIIIHNQ